MHLKEFILVQDFVSFIWEVLIKQQSTGHECQAASWVVVVHDNLGHGRALYTYLNLVTMVNTGHSENDIVVLFHQDENHWGWVFYFLFSDFCYMKNFGVAHSWKVLSLGKWDEFVQLEQGCIHHLERTNFYSMTR